MLLFRLVAAVILSVILCTGYGHAGFTENGFTGNNSASGSQEKVPLGTMGSARTKYRDDEILVKFRAGVSEERRNDLHKKHGARKLKEFGSLRLHHVQLKKGMSVEEAVKFYQADPDVEYAEPDFLYKAMVTPNDPQYSQLWGMAKINAPAAWDSTTGNNSVVVAIIDTGIDYTHPDLAANIWANPAEIADNSLDDDGNGYVDDLGGINTTAGSGNPMDDNGHGTHVAGTIGAGGNNGVGVVGVNWDVKMIACKFLGADGYGATSDAVDCLQYIKSLKDRGVNIVATNNSWGCSDSDCYSQALYDAINAQRDIIFIAAAGNSSVDTDITPHYPSNYDLPNVIAVAATDSSDGLADFSNYGRRGVHLAAPGSSIFSTFPTTGAFSTYGYRTLSGTSMAAPHVTGLAALLKSQDMNRNWITLKNLLFSGGDLWTALRGVTVTGRRINAFNSLNCAGRPVFSVLKFPKAPVVGQPQALSALSINCGAPAGPVTVSLSGGGTITLQDDGVAPDAAVSDGIFTGTWLPTGTEVERLTYIYPTGSESVASPPITITGHTIMAPPEAFTSGNGVFSPVDAYFSMRFTTSGGLPNYSWAVTAGSLPPGLSIDGQTGEISGTPSSSGIFTFTVQVSDNVGMKESRVWSITISSGLRPGWPKELARRTGYGMLPPSYSPVFADLDGDGGDEIIAVDDRSLYLLNETGMYKKVVLPGRLSAPAVVDLDNDGDKEIIVTASFDTATPIYAFHADLTPVAGFPAGAFNNYTFIMGSPVVADLQNDGSKQIIAVAHPNLSTFPDHNREIIQVVDPAGRTLSGWPKIVGTETTPVPYDKTVAVGDIDNDGVNEIVFASVDGTVHIYRKDGTEVAHWPIADTVSSTKGPVLADMNGDGIPDIIIGHANGNSCFINIYNRDGLSLSGWQSKWMSTPLAAADLDGDGTPEIIVGTGEWINGIGQVSSLSAYRADGSNVPGWPVMLPDRSFISLDSNLIVGDIDGDSRNEVLINVQTPSGGCTGTTCGSYDSALHAFTFEGQAVSGFPKNIPAGIEVRSTPAIGDLDSNSRADIVLKGEDGLVYVWESAAPSVGRTVGWPVYLHDPQHTRALPPAMMLPKSHDFGQLTINTTSPPQSFAITNRDLSAIVVNTVDIAGPDSSAFSLSSGTCGALPVSLAPAASCTVQVAFAPTISGSKSAAIVVNSSAGRGVVNVPLAGTGILPKYVLTLTMSGEGSGVVGISPGTVCSENCSYQYDAGTQVTLTPTPNVISLFSGWQGACSGTGTCVVTMDGDRQADVTFTPSGIPPNMAISAGLSYTVAAKADGTVWSWGDNSGGQLGDGSTIPRATPVQVPGLSGVIGIAAGGNHTVALKADGTVWAWGDNWFGQLGDGTTTDRLSPVQVPGISGVVALAAGYLYTVAVKSDGTVWAWGRNDFGQLGDGTTTSRTTPVQLPNLSGVTATAASYGFTIALKGNGTVWAWGTNSTGQLGDGTTTQRLAPTMVPGLTGITAVDSGWNFAVALKDDGTIWTWGDNGFGQLGDGTTDQRLSPVQAPGIFTRIAAGGYHTLAVRADSTAWAWGRNVSGQLGDGTTTQRLSPIRIQGLSEVRALAGGMNHTVALKSDGVILTWGHNYYGQLGDGSVSDHALPAQVEGFNAVLPAASIGGTPASPAYNTVVTLTVGGAGIVAYKYRLDEGVYSAEIPVATPIILGSLSEGTHAVSVRGKDSGGNWQTNPTTVSWTVNSWPVTIPLGGGFRTISEAYTALQTDSILQIRGLSLLEDLVLNRNIKITLRGGYDPATGTYTGFTTINGSVVISAGTVEVENLALLP